MHALGSNSRSPVTACAASTRPRQAPSASASCAAAGAAASAKRTPSHFIGSPRSPPRHPKRSAVTAPAAQEPAFRGDLPAMLALPPWSTEASVTTFRPGPMGLSTRPQSIGRFLIIYVLQGWNTRHGQPTARHLGDGARKAPGERLPMVAPPVRATIGGAVSRQRRACGTTGLAPFPRDGGAMPRPEQGPKGRRASACPSSHRRCATKAGTPSA